MCASNMIITLSENCRHGTKICLGKPLQAQPQMTVCFDLHGRWSPASQQKWFCPYSNNFEIQCGRRVEEVIHKEDRAKKEKLGF